MRVRALGGRPARAGRAGGQGVSSAWAQWCRCRCRRWRCTWARWRRRARCTRRCSTACCTRPPSASSTARPSAACSTASARTSTCSTTSCPWRSGAGPPASSRYATPQPMHAMLFRTCAEEGRWRTECPRCAPFTALVRLHFICAYRQATCGVVLCKRVEPYNLNDKLTPMTSCPPMFPVCSDSLMCIM